MTAFAMILCAVSRMAVILGTTFVLPFRNYSLNWVFHLWL